MDFIYSRLNNNLVDINRIDTITLEKATENGKPLTSLIVGDFYLKVTVVDSDKISYCDLSQLNDEENDILEKLYAETDRAIKREDLIEKNSVSYIQVSQARPSGIITFNLYNKLDELIDTKTLDLETEKIITDITLDYEGEEIEFTLVDGTIIKCDISSLIDDLNQKIVNEFNRADAAEKLIQTNLNNEVNRAKESELNITNNLNAEIERSKQRENQIELNSGSTLNIKQEESSGIVTLELINKLNQIIDTKTLDLGTEKIIKSIKLDYENKKLIFTLIDNTTLECDISLMINDLDQKIVNEKTRAEEAETQLQTNINTEADIRQNSVTNLMNLISAEGLRASTAENNITDNLNSEISRARQAEQNITTNLSNEVSRATEEELSIRSDFKARTDELSSSLDNLDKEVKANKSDYDSYVKANDLALQNETEARIQKDSELETSLSTTNARIRTEVANLNSTITSNKNDIETKLSTAQEALNAKDAELVEKIVNEESRATQSENSLDDRLKVVEIKTQNIDPKNVENSLASLSFEEVE